MNMERATHVCIVCKSRKRACDKVLPCCGSCARRGFPCSYAEPRGKGNYDNSRNKDDHALQLLNGAFTSVPLCETSGVNIHAVPYFQLCKILRQTSLSVSTVGEHYFRDFHRSLPIICPTLFREKVAKYKDTSPPADFSVLLLALCLLALNPASNSRLHETSGIYDTVQIIFARVQAHICVSTSLVQARLVIAAYEYASGHPRAASISLGTCARMITSTVSNIQPINNLHDLPHDRATRLSAREGINLWWGVATLERIVLCDIPGCKQSPILKYPGPNAILPPDLPPAQNHSEHISFPACATLGLIHAKNVDGFGRQIQITHLLDRLICTILNPLENTEEHITALQSLDRDIQTLMAVLIRDCDHEWRYYCGAIGTGVRTLFLLHEHIQTIPTNGTNIEWLRTVSRAGLRFATNLMVDVAYDHLQRVTPTNAAILPLSCAYNLHAAIKHTKIQEVEGSPYDAMMLQSNRETLKALNNICYERWRKFDLGLGAASNEKIEYAYTKGNV